jgi:hypothetical protein
MGQLFVDWAAAGMKAPWQPRLERWGWKVLAERA